MKILFLAATLWLASCAHQPAVSAPGLGTSVSGAHIANVTRDVQGWHDVQNPKCKFSRAVKASVIERDSDGVTELWTIEGCNGRLFDYEAYIMSMGGGITVMVSNADGSGATVAGREQEVDAPSAAECDAMRKEFESLSKEGSETTDYSAMAELAANLAVCNASVAP